ncbi:hypothetical protein HETIRDRAFT_389539 [Heterobasidion irregulare TC 32-1]|uniref:PPM-type phosphatase domain-containing protein n=1 Tax=Heterobasidion irregulare (strain TC 32-1) TaxID=747525 RepID=W4JSJ3_HETIT|nr:uncharacterized protein HETIRDRAFT_389539 [Heterobasidion irregulare TC 32-1]ETW76513.1 hypothetical protein HETIRDRAFT_389539 [Heterobasidion irregulare TC 32-1]
MSTLDDLRGELAAIYADSKIDTLGIHTVTFQPLRSRISEDRLVTEEWNILGQQWLFLAVLDGHGGTAAVQHAANILPARIRTALHLLIQHHLRGRLDRNNSGNGTLVSMMLREEIEKFDRSIGEAVKSICPKPYRLTEDAARALIQEHMEVLQRAHSGTTLAAVLVNVSEQLMWAVGVGDSTVALSTLGTNGKRSFERLVDLHSPKNPLEYFRVAMAHPATEKEVLIEDRLLGSLAMTRAIGNFKLKFHHTYLSHLLRFVPTTSKKPPEKVIPRIITPPYLIVEPSVRFIDLQLYRTAEPIVMLYSDGVDCLVDGYSNFSPDMCRKSNPCQVVTALLQDSVDPFVEEALEHKVELRWTGPNGNKAVDVLGNLVGGTNVDKLKMVMDQEILADRTEQSGFYIDDVSIIIFEVSKTS